MDFADEIDDDCIEVRNNAKAQAKAKAKSGAKKKEARRSKAKQVCAFPSCEEVQLNGTSVQIPQRDIRLHESSARSCSS